MGLVHPIHSTYKESIGKIWGYCEVYIIIISFPSKPGIVWKKYFASYAKIIYFYLDGNGHTSVEKASWIDVWGFEPQISLL